MDTFFAPAGRTDINDFRNQEILIKANNLLTEVIDGVPELIIIMNTLGELVAANNYAKTFFIENKISDISKKRFGEILNCIHLKGKNNGCGTTKACRYCGAAQSIEYTRKTGIEGENECRIRTEDEKLIKAFDFKVKTKRISIGNESFIMFYAKDIASEKRKEVLERIFFHDVLNTASSIKGLTSILPDITDKSELREIESALESTSTQLINEIKSQRELLFAEDGHFQLQPVKISLTEILNSINNYFVHNEVAKNKKLKIETHPEITLKIDSMVLIRSISNLVKNAFEAVVENKEVVISVELKDTLKFNIKNEGVIPDHIQLQIFNRSFSTKGEPGRGIGTYSVKTLIENYIGGKVYFISTPKTDTIFTIEIPSHYII